MKIALIVPLYKPCDKALPFLSSIDPNSFEKIIVIDDGSGEYFQSIFEEIKKLTNFEVISYPINKGKGYALKTGFQYIKENCPDIRGIVTADGDGQHLLEDIIKIRDTLDEHPNEFILGVRNFKVKECPSRNRFGNRFSSGYFRLATGVKVSDTQTGLRGIPFHLFDLAIQTVGERYEYEFRFLSDAVKEADVIEIMIHTVYDNNENSHFRAIRDSIRIYKTPILYLLVAVTSFLLDLGLFTFLHHWCVASIEFPLNIFIPYLGARLASGPYNFLLNTFLVFPTGEGTWRKLERYIVVYFVNIIFGLSLLFLFDYVFPKNFGLTFLKLCVELIVFIANFFVSKLFIFAKKNIRR